MQLMKCKNGKQLEKMKKYEDMIFFKARRKELWLKDCEEEEKATIQHSNWI